MSTQSSAKAYLERRPEDTHSPQELEALHRAIRFTNMFKKDEAMAKMDTEGAMEMPLPYDKFLRNV